MKQVSAQQDYDEFSRHEIFMTPLLTPNICSLSDGNFSASDRFPPCASSRYGWGLEKYFLLACKCICFYPCCALNMVITADVSTHAQWRVSDWMDIIKMDLIGVERKGVDCLRLTQDKDE
jgi:hypothetical protein